MRINDAVTGYLRDRLRDLPGSDHDTHDGRDPLDQIEKLGALREAGLITPEEFDAKKAQLLSRV
jgi:hypothetical protein